MGKIIKIIVKDFKCEHCGSEEYFVIDPYSTKRKICCDRCGMVQDVEDEVENARLWERTKKFISKKLKSNN